MFVFTPYKIIIVKLMIGSAHTSKTFAGIKTRTASGVLKTFTGVEMPRKILSD